MKIDRNNKVDIRNFENNSKTFKIIEEGKSYVT